MRLAINFLIDIDKFYIVSKAIIFGIGILISAYCELIAVSKCLISNGFNTFGDYDLYKISTVIKAVVSY